VHPDVVVAAKNLQTWSVCLSLLAELNRRGIAFIVIKSLPQVEELYESAGGRGTTDVDILVRGADALDVIQIALAMGWRHAAEPAYRVLCDYYGERRATEIRAWALISSGQQTSAVLDLHPDSTPLSDHPPLHPGVWKRAVETERDGVRFWLLSPEDRLIFLCWHLFADGLRPACRKDIQLILGGDLDLDWPYIARASRRIGCSGFVLEACNDSAKQIGMAHPYPWTGTVRRASPVRQGVASTFLPEETRVLTPARRMLLRAAMHDHLADALKVLADTLFPGRLDIGANYLGHWPTSWEYLRALASIYVGWLRRHLFRLT
jgi:hypothetical protein